MKRSKKEKKELKSNVNSNKGGRIMLVRENCQAVYIRLFKDQFDFIKENKRGVKQTDFLRLMIDIGICYWRLKKEGISFDKLDELIKETRGGF